MAAELTSEANRICDVARPVPFAPVVAVVIPVESVVRPETTALSETALPLGSRSFRRVAVTRCVRHARR
ncbi:hypothetical protein C461_12054 [Halorubrum aidingense JCM 13560]|uniref:Uncharacterized protein n=1 Tax=Halorubrum aidingense JCM 13560 TaxID=1230454 RepID=M0P880_9EURY|nr:hypothetical protein C461_12054 [Halorubrum aidingense JCM 13560]